MYYLVLNKRRGQKEKEAAERCGVPLPLMRYLFCSGFQSNNTYTLVTDSIPSKALSFSINPFKLSVSFTYTIIIP